MANLYIHVPFCRAKCGYCDFASQTDLSLAGPWLDALEREAATAPDLGVFATVYLGGGTPSLLPEGVFERLFSLLASRFAIEDGTEVTVELNPEDATPAKLACLESLGVNRLSIGVQSLRDAELRFLGRRHSARQGRNALALALKRFRNVSADLIFGFAEQTTGSWRESLEGLSSAGVPHLSCYQLTLKEGTGLKARAQEGVWTPLDEEDQAEFFEIAASVLGERGYRHYEVSNYASEERFFCRHNVDCWRHRPYLGLGPSAHSFDGTRRWANTADTADYCGRLERGESPVAFEELLDERQLLLERVALALRTAEGIEETLLPAWDGREEALSRLEREGLVIRRDGRVRPTEKGFLLADGLPLTVLP